MEIETITMEEFEGIRQPFGRKKGGFRLWIEAMEVGEAKAFPHNCKLRSGDRGKRPHCNLMSTIQQVNEKSTDKLYRTSHPEGRILVACYERRVKETL